MRFPDQKFSVVILANRGDINPTALSYRVADVFLEDQYVSEPDEKTSEETDPEPKDPESEEETVQYEMEQLTGKFEVAPGTVAEISIQNDSLHVLQLWNKSEYNLYRTGNNTFEISNESSVQFTFSELKDGYAQVLTVMQNGSEIPAKRLLDTDLSNLNMSEYTGDYYSREIDATYQILLKGDSIIAKIPNTSAMDLNLINLDEFITEGIQVRFMRLNKAISGFELDAGRVQNLKFEKK